jgi:cysteinyl-tRNA synthetase
MRPRATGLHPSHDLAIEKLIKEGHSYESGRHVLVRRRDDAQLWQTLGRRGYELIAVARVEVAPYKKDSADFVLWKTRTQDAKAGPFRWGPRSPGGTIECSRMADDLLGETFDIHGWSGLT